MTPKSDSDQSNGATWWQPALFLTVLSIIFAAGVYVGRADTREAVARLEVEIRRHEEQPMHLGSVAPGELRQALADIDRRLSSIERKIQ